MSDPHSSHCKCELTLNYDALSNYRRHLAQHSQAFLTNHTENKYVCVDVFIPRNESVLENYCWSLGTFTSF